MCGRVLQLVRLVVPLLEGDEDAEIVLSRADLDRGAGEFGADLVESASVDPLFWTVDPESTDGRVVRRLLREVGDAHRTGRVLGSLGHRDCRGGLGVTRAQA